MITQITEITAENIIKFMTEKTHTDEKDIVTTSITHGDVRIIIVKIICVIEKIVTIADAISFAAAIIIPRKIENFREIDEMNISVPGTIRKTGAVVETTLIMIMVIIRIIIS